MLISSELFAVHVSIVSIDPILLDSPLSLHLFLPYDRHPFRGSAYQAGQWVYVKYSDTGKEDANAQEAPAVIVDLFGYARRDFALIA